MRATNVSSIQKYLIGSAALHRLPNRWLPNKLIERAASPPDLSLGMAAAHVSNARNGRDVVVLVETEPDPCATPRFVLLLQRTTGTLFMGITAWYLILLWLLIGDSESSLLK